MYNSVVCIYYNPKHSSEPIKIKSDVVFNDNVEEYKLKWWLSDYNNVNFSCLVDNPEDYKHIKRCVKPIDKYYDGVDNEYLFDL